MRTLSAILVGAAMAACASLAPTSRPAPGHGSTSPAATSPAAASSTDDGLAVLRIVDGDTIVVALGGSKGSKVRLIGIDTPERDECLYRSATERMRALIADRRVRLERDVSETDRYGRLLRYVYVGDVFVNAALVSEGYASAATYPPDVAHALEFVSLEREARLAKRGLWSEKCFP